MEAKQNVEKTNMVAGGGSLGSQYLIDKPLQELEDLEYNIKQLKHAIREKTNPLKVYYRQFSERERWPYR